jgi:hypothetical protein
VRKSISTWPLWYSNCRHEANRNVTRELIGLITLFRAMIMRVC